jgi:hypothetical protein
MNHARTEWATTMNESGKLAYKDRIRGDRADNIEQAIDRLPPSPDGEDPGEPARRVGTNDE